MTTTLELLNALHADIQRRATRVFQKRRQSNLKPSEQANATGEFAGLCYALDLIEAHRNDVLAKADPDKQV